MKAICIVNPASRRSRRRWNEAEALAVLRDAGYEASVRYTTRAGEATEIAKSALRDGVDLVFACGGDGTFNEVLNALAGSETPLAFVALGTTNIWQLETRLPADATEAVRAALGGQRVR